MLAVGLLGAAACCPPPEPQAPTIITIIVPAPAPKPKPVPAVAHVAVPDVKTETKRDRTEPLERDSLEETPTVPPAGPKTEVTPPARETLAPPAGRAPRDTLPEEVVLQLIASGRPLFLRCLKKAIAKDPALSSYKVTVHVELDEQATITAAKAATNDTELAGCVERAVHWLRFPVTGKVIAVELPLFYRVE